jgi:hypothetical protein
VDINSKKVDFLKTTESQGGYWKNSYGTLGCFRTDRPTKLKVTFNDCGLIFGISTKDLDLSAGYEALLKQDDESDPFYGICTAKNSSFKCNIPEFQTNWATYAKPGDSYEITYDPTDFTLSIKGDS